jgi:hypothetical protein
VLDKFVGGAVVARRYSISGDPMFAGDIAIADCFDIGWACIFNL